MDTFCSFLWLSNVSLCVCIYWWGGIFPGVAGFNREPWGCKPWLLSRAFQCGPLGWGGWVGGYMEEEPRLNSSESQPSIGCLLWSSVGLWIWKRSLILLQENLTESPSHTDKEYLWVTLTQYPRLFPSFSFPFSFLLSLSPPSSSFTV